MYLTPLDWTGLVLLDKLDCKYNKMKYEREKRERERADGDTVSY